MLIHSNHNFITWVTLSIDYIHKGSSKVNEEYLMKLQMNMFNFNMKFYIQIFFCLFIISYVNNIFTFWLMPDEKDI